MNFGAEFSGSADLIVKQCTCAADPNTRSIATPLRSSIFSGWTYQGMRPQPDSTGLQCCHIWDKAGCLYNAAPGFG